MKKIFIILLFLITPYVSLSQNTKLIDSLKLELKNRKVDDTVKVSILISLNEKLKYSKPEEAKNYALKSLEISKKINYKFGIASGNMHIGDHYLNRNQNDSALHYYNISKKYFKDINYIRGLIFVNHAMSIVKESTGELDKAIAITRETLKLINEHEEDSDSKTKFIGAQHDALSIRYTEKGNYKIALIEALKALKCFEEINDDYRKAGVLQQIGQIEASLKNYKTSIKYYKEAIDIFNKEEEIWSLTYANISLGAAYQNLEDYEKAKNCFDAAIDYAKKVEDKMALAEALNSLASLELINKNYSKAKQLLLDSKEISETENLQLSLANTYQNLAEIEYYNNKYSTALNYNDEAIKLTKPNNALPYLKRFYGYRSKILQALKKYDDAIFYLNESQKISDSLYSVTKTQQLEELKTIYETEKKEQEILLQKNEIDLLKQKGEINNLYKILFGIGFLLSLIAFYAVRQKLKRSKIEREKLDLELDFKKKELTTHALHLAKKNEVLESLKQQAKDFKSSENSVKGYNQLIRTINFDLKDDNNWENFSKYFEEVHKDFNSNVKQQFPNVTPNELRLMALLKMNLSSKEIANILNISHEGIKKARYRLRKKLGITTEDSLQDLVFNL
ncbi:tetratricopeptide repeat protein [Flaviramulus sp. BrNp1-15]|uniref:tetratricopeptide repeat protein n=1 Tax=Flaviramulus sp. BrNp1-15 TaxID=2916754 RepID=UPI001EE800AA|nr:tetratricopeptide repeat protein [Flaviramulus sp. BrNp1-15]ULC58565.1 tetratricopeptide repeat protein [Flaviramulus sp. BrNp1-15]